MSHSFLYKFIIDGSSSNPLWINGSFSVIADLLWLVREHFSLISLEVFGGINSSLTFNRYPSAWDGLL